MNEYIAKDDGNGFVEQVGELIRCKDCKYAIGQYDGDCYCYKDDIIYIGKEWNHYCSWAERKEE